MEDPIDQSELGKLIDTRGVLRVTQVEGEDVLARITVMYQTMEPGDELVLRDVGKLRYLQETRQTGRELAGDLKGEIACIQDSQEQATSSDVVFLDFGSRQGVVPGTEFTVYRDAVTGPDGEQVSPLDFPVAQSTGRLGLVEVISTELDTCAARVVKALSPLQVGDKVRYR